MKKGNNWINGTKTEPHNLVLNVQIIKNPKRICHNERAHEPKPNEKGHGRSTTWYNVEIVDCPSCTCAEHGKSNTYEYLYPEEGFKLIEPQAHPSDGECEQWGTIICDEFVLEYALDYWRHFVLVKSVYQISERCRYCHSSLVMTVYYCFDNGDARWYQLTSVIVRGLVLLALALDWLYDWMNEDFCNLVMGDDNCDDWHVYRSRLL